MVMRLSTAGRCCILMVLWVVRTGELWPFKRVWHLTMEVVTSVISHVSASSFRAVRHGMATHVYRCRSKTHNYNLDVHVTIHLCPRPSSLGNLSEIMLKQIWHFG